MFKKLIVMMILLLVVGCNSNTVSTKVSLSNSSNIVNGSSFFQYKGETYFVLPGLDGIYKFNKDISNKKIVVKGNFIGVQIENDWIYTRCNETGREEGIYRIKTDGSIIEKISYEFGRYINVSEDFLYYSRVATINYGEASTNTINDSNLEPISSKEGIFKTNISTKENIRLTDDKAMYISIDGDWIYYLNYSDFGKIYKLKTDGTDKQAIADDLVKLMVTEGEWIYFINKAGSIKRVKKDGTFNEIILETTFGYILDGARFESINMSNDCIYISTDSFRNGNTLLKYNLNTKEEIELYKGPAQMVNVIDDDLYFYSNRNFYQMKTDGTRLRKIANH